MTAYFLVTSIWVGKWEVADLVTGLIDNSHMTEMVALFKYPLHPSMSYIMLLTVAIAAVAKSVRSIPYLLGLIRKVTQ